MAFFLFWLSSMAVGATVEGWAALILWKWNERIGQNGYKNGVNEHKCLFLPLGEGKKYQEINMDLDQYNNGSWLDLLVSARWLT